MNDDVRVRRHTDGRVAIFDKNGKWRRVGGVMPAEATTGEGWSELLVAQLPEPDYEIMGELVWDRIPQMEQEGSTEVVATTQGPIRIDDCVVSWEIARFDALKMLAAVAACERYQAEQKTGSDDA